MSPGKHVLYSAITLGIVLIWFELTSTDIWLQDLLFNHQHNTWLLNNPVRVVRFMFYDGIKAFLVLSALAILISLLFFRHNGLVQQYRQGLRVVVISMITVPAVIGLLKDNTSVACPRDLVEYGGKLPYIKVFQSYPEDQRPEAKQRCFPAGHASGGFALMSLYFLFQTNRNRRLALLFGLSAGWLMGGYKMLLGHHFLSHTLVTMISAWLLINLIIIIDSFIFTRLMPRFIKPAGLQQSKAD